MMSSILLTVLGNHIVHHPTDTRVKFAGCGRSVINLLKIGGC
jgi:hypothetical protein